MATLFKSLSGLVPDYYTQKEKAEKKAGRKLSNKEFEDSFLIMPDNKSSVISTGTSTFDPVLCELMYYWFTRTGDIVIDPFAGGSVRGIVAVELGWHYCGVDLRKEQIDANMKNAEECCTGEHPLWICGDSSNIDKLANGEYDLVFTCPPYGNLEKYSDDQADISNMSDDDFDKTYTEILRKSVGMLRNDRFACIVVGNYRDKKGYLRDLVGLTVRAMESAGARYYNDFVFVTPVGSLPVRAGRAFQATRKMGRTHQYCLVFVKGNPKKAAERLGEVEIADMEQYAEDDE